mgnify:CR=1 FL=1
MGVDCFKTDFGERIPMKDAVYYSTAYRDQLLGYLVHLQIRQYHDSKIQIQNLKTKVRKYVNLKLSLMPYLYTQAAHNAKYGNPLMRPMWFDFTSDYNIRTISNQYMLGSQILLFFQTHDHFHEL